jgi:predicted O-methyltransferase YrrM
MLADLFYYRPRLEAAFTALDKARLKLPVLNLHRLFDDFDSQPVVLTELPHGPWSSPVADIVMLAKIALCLRSRRVLEVGSYRGYTAKLLAEHTSPEARIVAFDRDPHHGAAYRASPLAAKIERRVGEVSPEAFNIDQPASYDLIFLDADHTYAAVKHDTEILLPLLASYGMFVWHDYANWGRFSKKNGVPEYLHELAATRRLMAVGGSWLAAHSPEWDSPHGANSLTRALQATSSHAVGADPWTVDNPRG